MPAYVNLPPDPTNPALRKFRLGLIQRLQLAGYDVSTWTMQRAQGKTYLVIQAEGPMQAKTADQKVLFFYTAVGTDYEQIPSDERDDFILYGSRAQRIRPDWNCQYFLLMHNPEEHKTYGKLEGNVSLVDVTDSLPGVY